jgi:hypothetical protein
VCADIVLSDALAIIVHDPEIVEHGHRLARPLAIPTRRRCVVRRDARSHAVHVPEIVLSYGVALLGGFAIPVHRSRITCVTPRRWRIGTLDELEHQRCPAQQGDARAAAPSHSRPSCRPYQHQRETSSSIGVPLLGKRAQQSRRLGVVALHKGGAGILKRPSDYRSSKADGKYKSGHGRGLPADFQQVG